MKLTKLELSGFKSFADTVTLTFEDGVTAIVGPNGCGKSNVSDAVRWVLGEQSARLLRGGKMEDVIFQGSAARRPVNVTEVSLFLDNTDGDLPIAYREVVITRRLSRSGQSDYLLNGSPVRLRDIQDLLRGTGLGSDAGVVIEAKMIDLLLSDRADERRSLFEEAAGIGLYRDRKHSTERRLEETAVDLQRVEDLIAEVQSQIRSLARQRGKAERHAKLTEEKFAVQLTLARRLLDRLSRGGRPAWRRASPSWPSCCPRLASALTEARAAAGGRPRARGPPRRASATEIARRLAARSGRARQARWRPRARGRAARQRARPAAPGGGRAGADASSRAPAGRRRAGGRRRPIATRPAASTSASGRELAGRAAAEEEVRRRLTEQRGAGARSGSRSSSAGPRRSGRSRASARRSRVSSPRCASGRPRPRRTARRSRPSWRAPSAGATSAIERAGFQSHETRRAAAEAEHARHLVAEAREREAMHRADRRQAEESLAQLTARRHALEELERDRVGLAPGGRGAARRARALRGGVLGPLSDFVTTGREDARAGRAAAGRLDARGAGARRGDGATRCRPGTRSSSRAPWCCSRSIPGPAASRRPLGR